MKATVLKYNVLIHKEGKSYIADVPTLGISDFGSTVDQAKKNIKAAIETQVEGLIKTKSAVPAPDTGDFYVSQTEIKVPFGFKLAI